MQRVRKPCLACHSTALNKIGHVVSCITLGGRLLPGTNPDLRPTGSIARLVSRSELMPAGGGDLPPPAAGGDEPITGCTLPLPGDNPAKGRECGDVDETSSRDGEGRGESTVTLRPPVLPPSPPLPSRLPPPSTPGTDHDTGAEVGGPPSRGIGGGGNPPERRGPYERAPGPPAAGLGEGDHGTPRMSGERPPLGLSEIMELGGLTVRLPTDCAPPAPKTLVPAGIGMEGLERPALKRPAGELSSASQECLAAQKTPEGCSTDGGSRGAEADGSVSIASAAAASCGGSPPSVTLRPPPTFDPKAAAVACGRPGSDASSSVPPSMLPISTTKAAAGTAPDTTVTAPAATSLAGVAEAGTPLIETTILRAGPSGATAVAAAGVLIRLASWERERRPSPLPPAMASGASALAPLLLLLSINMRPRLREDGDGRPRGRRPRGSDDSSPPPPGNTAPI